MSLKVIPTSIKPEANDSAKPATKVSGRVVNHPSTIVNILHLYPNEMNIYGDRGNILALTRRLQWRGYEVILTEAGIDQEVDFDQADIIFGGGGQDSEQVNVGKDLQRHANALKKAVDAEKPMLVVCGTYQLFGHGFTTIDGEEIPGISLFDLKTEGSRLRMIGNAIVDTEFGRLVGFENHSGRTTLGENQLPLGKVVQGYGNDGKSGFEGARVKNLFGTYMHGPLLPKNPDFTDHLILQALKKRHNVTSLKQLDNSIENIAAHAAAKRPQ
jgi:lipid II isoglutaminyl synthase (glutamine-hydrolysing)